MSTTVELGRMRDQRDAALAELDKLRAGVEMLADEWQASFDRFANFSDNPRVGIFRAHANRLRNLLGSDS